MLTELHIQQLGVITESRLEPAPGLTAVTGETGAGKTMIVTGLGLLLGHRADPTMVRTGAEQARVEGVFTGLDDVATRLSELGAETDAGELIVARQLRTNGRSRAWLGGVAAPRGTGAGVVGELATIHGQLEQVRLGTEERQRQVLDRFGGKPVAEVLERYRELFELRRSVDKELNERVENSRERAREADLLAFGLSEIERVDPQPGEDTELATRAQRLQAMDDLRMLAQEASHALSGADDGDPDDPGVVGLAGIAVKNTGRIAEMDPQAEALGEQLNQLGLAAQEAAGALASYVAGLDADPLALETITTRRAELADLTRKYGENIDAVLDWARDASERIEDLGSDEQRIEALRTRRTQLDEQLHHQAEVLHGLRVKAAQHLASGVREELGALAMPHARLEFRLEPLELPGPWGSDRVSLLFSANPGSPLAPLAKVASGGELSRIRLGLEVVLAGSDPGHTFVFDEVDAGVGGQVATEIGRRLAKLARHSQVIVVTHLAQVAAFAERHYVVTKSSDGLVTTSDVELVSGDQRLHEIARLMAGSESDKALAHARELVADAAGTQN